jgi:hypothetical protein
VVFLDLSARSPDLSDDQAFDLVQEVADSSLDVGEIAFKPRSRMNLLLPDEPKFPPRIPTDQPTTGVLASTNGTAESVP